MDNFYLIQRMLQWPFKPLVGGFESPHAQCLYLSEPSSSPEYGSSLPSMTPLIE